MPGVELKHGNFAWVDLVTNDIEGSIAFYGALFGWSHSVDLMPQGQYHMFHRSGEALAGMVAMPPTAGGQGFPPIWMSYILVDDIDVAAHRCAELGGTVLMPPRDVTDAGRMCMIQDPTGASVGLWQARGFTGADLFNEPGAFTWNELITRDVDAACSFYGDLLGWDWSRMPLPDGSIYHVCLVGDRPNGGVMAMTGEWPADIPPYWAVYFQVEDVDAAHGRALELGATSHMAPEDISVGRLSVVADPAGAVFSLFRPAASAEVEG